MSFHLKSSPLALAAVAALGAAALGSAGMAVAQSAAKSQGKLPGKYVAGDFHNHTTCSDGSTSMQKLVQKSTSKTADAPWGLDWFVQAGHGGRGNRNCTLVEDESLATPAYPLVTGNTPFDFPTTGNNPPTGGPVPNTDNPSLSQYRGPVTTWAQSIGTAAIKGDVSGSGATRSMWRWQSVQEFQYPLLEYLAAVQNKPMFMGVESVVAGHEHTSMSVITGQMPAGLSSTPLPATGPYAALGNASALAMWEYCFDRNDTDTSRGNTTPTSGVGNNWDCSVPNSLNAADPSWSQLAAKLIPAGGAGTGVRGHAKTVEAVKWMTAFHPDGSYYVPAHLERAGPFNPDGNNGFNVEHLRNFNNAAPRVAFGMESQPGHGASSDRGEYAPRRNTIAGVRVDTAGGTTFGGTGVYAAQIGGVWDALLGEGRNWWFFASSDWHNRGAFGSDDRRSTQDFYPGEYQRNYTMVRTASGKLNPQNIVDGLRTGNNWAASGQIIDRLAFVACSSINNGPGNRPIAAVEALAMAAALNNTDVTAPGCATMGEKLVVRPGADVVVSIVVRDPEGSNYSPYTFANPSLKQVGIDQPLDKPVLDHVDVIQGLVSGYKQPGSADYAGAWPNNWVFNPDMATVPAAAKNTSAKILRTFNGSTWTSNGNGLLKMTFRIPAVTASQYVRLRGTNLPASVPFETDASGNPLRDLETNSAPVNATSSAAADGYAENFFLKIPCKTVGTTEFNGCPSHLPTKTDGSYTGKFSALDVAAWADLWFYSNPIFIEVQGSTTVAGVK